MCFGDFLHVLVFVYPTKRRSPVVPCLIFENLPCFFNSTMHLKVFVGKLTVEHRGVELCGWTTQVAWCVKLTMCWCLERLSDQNGLRVSIWKIRCLFFCCAWGGAFSLAFKPLETDKDLMGRLKYVFFFGWDRWCTRLLFVPRPTGCLLQTKGL